MSTARHVRRRMAAAASAAVAVLTLTSCGPSITDLVERSAASSVERRASSVERRASSVEDMQDDLWEYRDDIVADPETTIVALGRFIDFRQGVPPGYTRGGTLLLDVSDASDGPALTLLTSGGASTGGGWTYDQQTAAVCFTLTFPTTRD